ncbi:MAG: threonine/serine exporter family protein [Anaerolineae bacterium]|nr:threonine/serine exporter family protein [Anaerolineae bacterium]CAG0987650.1 Inner membrane protein YjjP [Anaerolineae bacterium]
MSQSPSVSLRQLSHHELAHILRVTMRFGLLMLRNGASSYRTEHAMLRMAEVMGVERLEAYVTPTGIIASAYSGMEHRTQIMRLYALAVDMTKISLLERLSRNMPENPTPELVSARLDEIETMKHQYPRWQIALAVGLACGSFSILIGGGPLEFTAAAFGAAVAQTVRFTMHHYRFTALPTTILAAAGATLTSEVLITLLEVIGRSTGLEVRPAYAVIASVLVLVPGVPLVTAVLDLTYFDLVSGIVRGIYAVMLFGAIGIGMLSVLVWTGLRII